MTDPTPKVRLRPVIRVFVSSTFSDMKHERNALQEQVFPKLEQLCMQHGFQFQAIDLRWGVSTEAGLDHRTMQICFDELRRAQEISPRPNFLILLGNRYGWRPLPEEISVEEFHTLEQAAVQIPCSADNSAVAVLREWYREDMNAVPPVYLLQSRRQDLGDDQDFTHDVVWNQVQFVLWTVINRAMPPEQLHRRFDDAAPDGSPPAIVRFQASATEQEIWHGALRVPDARKHVLAFFREIENLAAFSDPKQIKDFIDMNPCSGIDVALQTEGHRLKSELIKRLGSTNVSRNETPVRLVEAQDNRGGRITDVTTDHLAQLCDDVVSRLSEIIQGQIEEYWRNTVQASIDRAARELEIEQREYERFAKERGGEESFVGRQVELLAIIDYVESDSRYPMVIHGASGCGKTALLARASQEVAKIRKRIDRFIGVVPRSSDLSSLLSSLCQELRQQNTRPGALPTEIKEFRDEFSQHLQAATPEQPLILFLDALDQLSDADGGRLLNWLPLGSLPPHVKLIVSCLSDRANGDPAGQPFAELKRRQIPAENFINLDVLSESEARLLLFDRWLPKAGRTVIDHQLARIEQHLASPACRQPIYLKLLFEEVQLWHSYDPVPVPGESVPALLGQLFTRLSKPKNHGPLLVDRVLGYLAASRHGLAENEILEILFADPDYRAKLNEATEHTRQKLPPKAKRIPIALWSRLRFDLAPYLTERAALGANVLTFYHHQVAEWAQEYLAKSFSDKWNPHQLLARYFESKEFDSRRTDELPWQLLKSSQWHKLSDCLMNLDLFDSVWKSSKDDARTYWSAIEQNSELRATITYKKVIESLSTKYHSGLWGIATLLGDLGHPNESASIWELLLKKEDVLLGTEKFIAVCGNLAIAYKDLGRLKEALSLFVKQETFCRSIETPYAKYMLQNALGNKGLVLRRQGDVKSAIKCHREKQEICQTIKHQNGIATSLHNIAEILADQGNAEAALEMFREEEALTKTLGDREGVARSIGGQAKVAAGQGDFDMALIFLKQEESICRDLGFLRMLAICLFNQASLLRKQGGLRAAEQILQDAKQLCEKLGSKIILSHCMTEYGKLHIESYQWELANADYQEAEAICRELDYRDQLIVCLSNRSLICIHQKRFNDAIDLIMEAENICRSDMSRQRLCECLLTKAEAYYLNNQLFKSEDFQSQAEAISLELDFPRLRARCLNQRAIILILQNREEEAVILLWEAEKIHKRLLTKIGLAHTLMNQVLVLSKIEGGKIALDLLKQVQELGKDTGDDAVNYKALLLQAELLSRKPNMREHSLRLIEGALMQIRQHGGFEELVEYAEKMERRIKANSDGFLDQIEVVSGQTEHPTGKRPFKEALKSCGLACPYCGTLEKFEVSDTYACIKAGNIFDFFLPAHCAECAWGVLVCFKNGKVAYIEKMGSFMEFEKAKTEAEDTFCKGESNERKY